MCVARTAERKLSHLLIGRLRWATLALFLLVASPVREESSRVKVGAEPSAEQKPSLIRLAAARGVVTTGGSGGLVASSSLLVIILEPPIPPIRYHNYHRAAVTISGWPICGRGQLASGAPICAQSGQWLRSRSLKPASRARAKLIHASSRSTLRSLIDAQAISGRILCFRIRPLAGCYLSSLAS